MLTDLLHRLRSLFTRDRVDRELDEEMRFHLDQQIATYVRQGMTRDEAERRARVEFGGLDQIREEHRDQRGVALVEDLARDVRYGVRQLRRSPAFAAAALLCLALGIGATTAVYSLVDAILLRPLPFKDADRLVRLIEHVPAPFPGQPLWVQGLTYRELLDWRTQTKTFSDMAGVGGGGQRLVRTANGSAGLWGAGASPNLFSMLGVRPLLGRTLVAGDEVQSDVVVLGYEAWRRHFNSDPAIVGQRLEFRAGALLPPSMRVMTVVGVLPAHFDVLGLTSDFWMPIAPPTGGRPGLRMTPIALLAPGVSLNTAMDEANAIGSGMRGPWPANAPRLTVPRFQLDGLKDLSVQQLRPAFRVLLAAVAVVLLIVCANVANLLLARGTARQRELAVRVALGASRGRVARQIMTECIVMALAGGALGAALGAGGVALVKQLTVVDAPGIFRLMFGSTLLPRINEVQIDFAVLGIALAVATVTSVVFGVLPAMILSRTNHHAGLTVRGNAGAGASRTRTVLSVAQLTMATVMLVCAGLLARSFLNLTNVNNGYEPSHVLAVNLLFPDQYSVARKADTISTLLTRFRALPDVQAAGFSRHGLLIGETLYVGRFESAAQRGGSPLNERIRLRSVSAGFLSAMGVPVLDGREFTADDHATAPVVVVLNRSAARHYFGNARAVGQSLDWQYGPMPSRQVTVIGVVEDLRQTSPTDDVAPEIFVEYRQFLPVLAEWKQTEPKQNELAVGFLSFALRTGADPSDATSEVRQAVNAVDPNIGIDVISPMTRLVSNTVARQRFYAVTLGTFAAIAAILAIIGIYGVLSYAVVQRTQEIGIRLSLGAPRAQVLGLVLRKGLVLTTVGIVLGLLGASAGSRLLQGMLFGVTPLDVRTFAAVSTTFGFVAMIACYLPARRATKVDPIVALRQD
jgi:putative ABC transport system permease protein